MAQCLLLTLVFALLVNYISSFFFSRLIKQPRLFMPLTVLSKKGAPFQITTVSRRVDPENSSNKRIANVEKDYLGMINFCLRPTDTTLSGNSRSKLLNEATNDVFRALMVGNAAVLEDTLSRLKVFKDQCENSPFNVQDDEIKTTTRNIANESDDIYNSLNKIDLGKSCEYIAKLEKLILGENIDDSIIGGIYDKGYKRLITTLRDNGCKISPTVDLGTPNTGLLNRPTPTDTDICLSLIDLKNIENNEYKTKTKALNILSNYVSRAMIYGTSRERNILADYLQDTLKNIVSGWANGSTQSQETLYLKALMLLLKDDYLVAEVAVSYVDNSDQTRIFGASNITNLVIGNASGIGSKYDNNIVIIQNNNEREIPYLRLYDLYGNAFQRILEKCMQEVDNSNIDPFISLINLGSWEQSVRRNLTANMWLQNPSELVGTWELIDIAYDGNDDSVGGAYILSPSEFESMEFKNVIINVKFTSDGNVEIDHQSFYGESWHFRPGPAHLDTLEFDIKSKAKSNFQLKYVGFIDRGQRIESRISKSPVRMSGRVVSIINDEIRGCGRFCMSLKKK